MLKKASLIVALLLLTIFAVSCSSISQNTSENISDNTNEQDILSSVGGIYLFWEFTFTEAIDRSNCAAVAELVSINKHPGGHIEHQFRVKDVLRGETEEIIHVFDRRGHVYNIGDEYMLIMYKHDYIFYDYPQYSVIADIYIPMSDIDKATMYGESLSDLPNEKISGTANEKRYDVSSIKSIGTIIREAKPPENLVEGRKYIKTDEISPDNVTRTIVTESDVIFKVKIVALFMEGVRNASPYDAKVIEVLKGEHLAAMTDEGIVFITLMNGSVEVGKEYIVMVNTSSAESFVYVQSSVDSVIPVGDTAKVAEVNNLIAAQRDAVNAAVD